MIVEFLVQIHSRSDGINQKVMLSYPFRVLPCSWIGFLRTSKIIFTLAFLSFTHIPYRETLNQIALVFFCCQILLFTIFYYRVQMILVCFVFPRVFVFAFLPKNNLMVAMNIFRKEDCETNKFSVLKKVSHFTCLSFEPELVLVEVSMQHITLVQELKLYSNIIYAYEHEHYKSCNSIILNLYINL